MNIDPEQRADLVELVRKIMEVEGSEEEIDQMLDEFRSKVQHPRVLDLIYYSPDPDLTPEKVVDDALSYAPLAPPWFGGDS